jgi:radical SAM protein with 4Fe4S-binding SPASM domain
MPLCGAGINDLCVTVNGDVYPCAGWQAFVVGNVFKTSLKDIWEHSEQLKMIRRVTWKNFPKCLECDVRDYCNMCLVRNYNENNGDMFKTADHFCKVAKLNKQLAEEYKEKGLL